MFSADNIGDIKKGASPSAVCTLGAKDFEKSLEKEWY
jgi:hypothetical protein